LSVACFIELLFAISMIMRYTFFHSSRSIIISFLFCRLIGVL
jgi:hypothetical protein